MRSSGPGAEPPAGGEGLFDARELLRDVIDPEPVPDEPPGWSLRDAFAALERAPDRDEALRAFLRYAREFLEGAAVFAVTPEGVLGLDAVGWADARSRCRALRLGPQPGGVLGAALATRGPSLGPPARDPGNERLIGGLGRSWPAVVLALPVVMRDRVVALLYGDNGEAPVSAPRIGDLLLLAGAVSGALERVVRRAKAAAAEQAGRPPRDAGGWDLREPGQVAAPEAPPVGPESAPDEFQVLEPRDR